MSSLDTATSLEHQFDFVKSSPPDNISHSPGSMAHHKASEVPNKIIVTRKNICREGPYGVPRSHRVLTPSLLIKKHDEVRDCLTYRLGLTNAQRETALRLLNLYTYYGEVYPKASQVAEMPGLSIRTFWRTIRILEELGLVRRIPRYVLRPHAQISNLYLLDKLVILIARYLAEHIAHVWPDWLTPILTMPVQQFCRWVFQTPEARAGPCASAS